MDSLSFFDVESASVPTTLDIGTVGPSSSDDSTLRVINNSSLYQAKDVTVAITGTDAVQLWLSAEGDAFSATLRIGDIPPGGTSAVFWLRRVTPSGVADGPCTAALSATASGWSDALDSSVTDNVPLSTKD